MSRFEIRTAKGKVIESLVASATREEAVKRVKEIRSQDDKNHYELVHVETVYDTANEIESEELYVEIESEELYLALKEALNSRKG